MTSGVENHCFFIFFPGLRTGLIESKGRIGPWFSVMLSVTVVIAAQNQEMAAVRRAHRCGWLVDEQSESAHDGHQGKNHHL